MNFNERLKILRLDAGLTQKDLGKLIGVGRTTISEYESGKIVPKQKSLIALAEYFHVSMDYLTGVSDTPAATFNDNSNQYEVRLDETLLGAIKMITIKERSKDINMKIKYLDRDLTDNQLYLIREQLRCTLSMIDKLSKSNV